MTRAPLDQQLARLATLSPADLRAEWCRLFRAVTPGLGNDLLRRDLAYRLQERAHGGLAPDLRRRLDRLAAQPDGDAKPVRPKPEVVLRPGTRLVRDWHGRTYQVLVLEDGFLFEERHYASLTRIAGDITGANWSGPRFFGLRQKASAVPAAATGSASRG